MYINVKAETETVPVRMGINTVDMSDRYRAGDVNAAYFVTLTTVGWVDIFTRLNQKLAIVESLRYCQQHKELVIFAWCLMPSHLHLLCRAEGKGGLPDFLRDFKTHTSRQAVRLIMEEPESRREWLLPYLQQACPIGIGLGM